LVRGVKCIFVNSNLENKDNETGKIKNPGLEYPGFFYFKKRFCGFGINPVSFYPYRN